MSIVRLFLGRIIGAAVAGLATWLLAKFGIGLDEDTQAKMTEVAVIVLMTVFTIIYSIVHKTADRKLNPGDAASAKLATSEKLERERMG